jgi:hypothetical protein
LYWVPVFELQSQAGKAACNFQNVLGRSIHIVKYIMLGFSLERMSPFRALCGS